MSDTETIIKEQAEARARVEIITPSKNNPVAEYFSSSSTPETDAVATHEGNWDTKALRMTAHARKLERERDNWEQTAAHYLDGMHYYRGLVERVGETLGEAAYTQDDGGKVDSVLCAKVPELVEELKSERDEANYFLRELAEVDGQLKVRICELCEVLRKTEKERDEAILVMRETRRRLDDAWLEIERLKNL